MKKPSIRAVLILLLSAVVSTCAWGQATVLQGGPWAPGHTPQYVGQGSSQPVIQDGGGAGGGVLGVNPSEQGLTIRSPTNTYPAANAGTGQFGANWCDYDAPITNPSGYHFFCISPNAQGGGLIAYGAVPPAAQQQMVFNINGVAYQFPFSLNGVLGPPTSVIGDIAAWNNTTGSLLKDVPVTGTGSVVEATGPTISSPTLTGCTGPVFGNGSSPIRCGGPYLYAIQQFGAVCDGTTDDAAALQAALSAMHTSGGVLVIGRGATGTGECFYNTGLTFNSAIPYNWVIQGPGVLKPGPLVTKALEIDGSSPPNFGVITGLTFNFTNNTTIVAGINAEGTTNLSITYCSFILDTIFSWNPNFGSIYLQSLIPGNEAEVAIWTTVANNDFRPRAGGGALPPYDVVMVGQANATHILANNFGTGINAVASIPDAVDGNVNAGVLIDGNWFEGVTVGVTMLTNPVGGLGAFWQTGWVIANNRAESVTTFARMALTSGSSSNNGSQPPVFYGNQTFSSVTTYLSNTSGALYSTMDFYAANTTRGLNQTVQGSINENMNGNLIIGDLGGHSTFANGMFQWGQCTVVCSYEWTDNNSTGLGGLWYKSPFLGAPASATDGFPLAGLGLKTVSQFQALSGPVEGSWGIASDLVAPTYGAPAVGGGVAQFVGGITTGTLTVSSVISGTIGIGQTMPSPAAPHTTIVSGSGSTWVLSPTQNVAGGTTFTSHYHGRVTLIDGVWLTE